MGRRTRRTLAAARGSTRYHGRTMWADWRIEEVPDIIGSMGLNWRREEA